MRRKHQQKCSDQNVSSPDLQLRSEKVKLDKNAAWWNSKTNKLITQQEKSKGEQNADGFLNKLKMLFRRTTSKEANQKLTENNDGQEVEKKYKRRKDEKKHNSKNLKEVVLHQMEENPFKIKHDTNEKVKNLHRKILEIENLKQEHEVKSDGLNPYEKYCALKKLGEQKTSLRTESLENKIKHELNEELKYFSWHLESIFNEKFEMFLKNYQQQRDNRKREREELAKRSKKRENSEDYTERIVNEVIKRLTIKNSLGAIQCHEAPEMSKKPQRQLHCDTVLILNILPKTPKAIQTRNNNKQIFFKNLKNKYESKEVNIRPEAVNINKLGHGTLKNVPGHAEEDLQKLPKLQQNRLSSRCLKNTSEKSSPVSLKIDESYLTPLPSLKEYCWSKEKVSKRLDFEYREDVKLRPENDSGIDIMAQKPETYRNKSKKHQNLIKAVQREAKSKPKNESAFQDESNTVSRCQSEPKAQKIDDDLQKHFDGISKTIDVIQHLYYATKPSAEKPVSFNKDQNKHFPGIFKTIDSLKDMASNIREPGGASQKTEYQEMAVDVDTAKNLVQQTSKIEPLDHEANGTSAKKDACCDPQTPKAIKPTSRRSSANQEPISNVKSKTLLELNVTEKVHLRRSKSDICRGKHLEITNGNRMYNRFSIRSAAESKPASRLYSKDYSIAGKTSAFGKRKQYDEELRKKMSKKKYKVCKKRQNP